MDGNLTTGDLALMRDNDGFGGGGGFFWVFALFLLGVCPADSHVWWEWQLGRRRQ